MKLLVEGTFFNSLSAASVKFPHTNCDDDVKKFITVHRKECNQFFGEMKDEVQWRFLTKIKKIFFK